MATQVLCHDVLTSGVQVSTDHPWIVSRAVNGRPLLSRKPVQFRICAGVSFRLKYSERARLGRSDISRDTIGFSWALDRLYRYHKKAETVQKHDKVTNDTFSISFSFFLTTDQAGGVGLGGNADGHVGSARLHDDGHSTSKMSGTII